VIRVGTGGLATLYMTIRRGVGPIRCPRKRKKRRRKRKRVSGKWDRI